MNMHIFMNTFGKGSIVRRLKWYHPSMKWIRSPRTALWYILAVYITCMCPCDLDLWPIFTKIGSHDRKVMLDICGYFEINSYLWKMQISWRYCYATDIAMATSLCTTIFWGNVRMSAPDYKVDRPTYYWVIAIFNSLRDLVTLTFDFFTASPN